MIVAPKSVSVAFVVRASVSDGLGHLVRSLSVFRELQDLTSAHLFLLGDSSGKHLVEEASVPWAQCESDEACMQAVIEAAPRVIVFDTLSFERAYFDRLAQRAITVSLSPIFSCMDGVEHLFHRTRYEPPEWGESKPFPKIHKGLRYTILPAWLKRVSAQRYRETLSERKMSIAISMGGADAPNRTLALLRQLSHSPQNMVIWVALGEAYTHSYEDLLRCAKENRQEIILLKSNESMWRMLQHTSLIICAGGLTTYEAAYIGIPSINILQSAEWAYLFSELAESGVCHVLRPSEFVIEQASMLVSELVNSREQLLDMHERCRGLIPPNGAKKVAKEILALEG